jgi:hypothetical protein
VRSINGPGAPSQLRLIVNESVGDSIVSLRPEVSTLAYFLGANHFVVLSSIDSVALTSTRSVPGMTPSARSKQPRVNLPSESMLPTEGRPLLGMKRTAPDVRGLPSISTWPETGTLLGRPSLQPATSTTNTHRAAKNFTTDSSLSAYLLLPSEDYCTGSTKSFGLIPPAIVEAAR